MPSTPPGTYRFVVDGTRRGGTDPCPDVFAPVPLPRCEAYHLTSEEFEVGHWSGITVPDIRAEGDRSLSFSVGPVSTYSVSFVANNRRFQRDPDAPNVAARLEWYCDECSFRPWADTGAVATAFVTIDPAGDGPTVEVPATLGPDGRWHTAPGVLGSGDIAYVAAGGIVDINGEYNGTASESISG